MKYKMLLQNIFNINNPSVDSAVCLLKTGGVIALPTDTIYGLACDATDPKAINKLYSIKCRNENKPLAICLSDIEDIKNHVEINHIPFEMVSKLLPGPVTLILKNLNIGLDKSVIKNNKIGIRIPNYDFIRNVIRNFGKPLALTSANLSNQPSSVKIEEFSDLWGKLDGIFDGGNLSDGMNRSGSTIVDLTKIGFYKIIRDGSAMNETCDILKQHGLKSLD